MIMVSSHRVVLDTNTIIGAGSRWLAEEPPHPVSMIQRLVYAVASSHVGLYCDGMLEEYVEVMCRKNHPEDRIAKFVAFLIALFTNITVTTTTCDAPPTDLDDIIFIFCALDGDADLLVSDDRHLQNVREKYLPRPNIVRALDACTHLKVESETST